MGELGGTWTSQMQRILLWDVEGMPQREIAEKLGVERSLVYRIQSRAIYVQKKSALEGNALQRVRELFKQKALTAAEKIVQVCVSGKPAQRVQFEAAKEILYQMGMKPIDVIENKGRDYTPEELKGALDTLKEIENVTARLAGGKSRFFIDTTSSPQPGAPVSKAPLDSPVVSSDVPESPVTSDMNEPGSDSEEALEEPSGTPEREEPSNIPL